MENIQNLFFDLDGTLTNPHQGIVNCILFALRSLEKEPAAKIDLSKYIGPPLRETFSELLNTNDTAYIERAVETFRERFTTIGIFENHLYEDIPDVLASLRSMQKSLFVITTKPRNFAIRIVEHFSLAQYFDDVYGPELDGRFDNKADLISHVLTERQLASAASIMIGDRENDIRAAKANSVRTLAVSYGYGSIDELMSAGAEHICHSPREIPQALSKFF